MRGYQKFIANRVERVRTIENVIRSLSYLLPGRFTDSDLAAEAIYAALSLFRQFHEALLAPLTDRTQQSLYQTTWNAYIDYLRRQSPLMDAMITMLNITWTIEVPLEMIVERFGGMRTKMRSVLALEIIKYDLLTPHRTIRLTRLSDCRSVARIVMFIGSDYRMGMRHYIPDINWSAIKNDNDARFVQLLKQIDTAAPDKKALADVVRRNRIDPYTLAPELSVAPMKSVLERLGEVLHIIRPLVYAGLLQSKKPRLRWIAWIVTLLIDLAVNWSQTGGFRMSDSKKHDSPIEKNEKQIRYFKLLLYLLRDPVYSVATKPYADSIMASFSKWYLLGPLISTCRVAGICSSNANLP